MFVRLLFLLLIALNIGVGAWLVFGHAPVRALPPAPIRACRSCKLLSEQAVAVLPAALAAQRVPRRRREGDGKCLRIGPFDTQSDTRDAIHALTPHVADIQYRQEQTTQSTGWWVYLPPLPSRDQALAVARQLSAKGVSDYYVVTAGRSPEHHLAGPVPRPGQRQRRQKQLVDLGFQPQMQERTETLPQYWVDIALPRKPGFDWHAYRQARRRQGQPGQLLLSAAPRAGRLIECPGHAGIAQLVEQPPCKR